MNLKKIAIFVEGQTEQIFVVKLLKEIARQKDISIKIYKFQGTKSRRTPHLLEDMNIENSRFFALLYDCTCESQVLSDIKSQHQSLTQNNYTKIIGVRDLYPKSLDDKQKIENGMKGFIKPLNKTGIPIYMILAIMEIEAWFLAEWQCFSKIDKLLTYEFILQSCGLDLINIDVETIPHPSDDIDKIYQLIGRNYTKTKEQVTEIVESIDYQLVLSDVVKKAKQLKKLIEEIDEFLSQSIP
ncbi:DUF4276 family protein [Crocosphaera sp. XPORK-15E]|uniref:DUF4276 family protein n=1 Tax=Crocosphaera sp. XPORK-15E TaxID=3110247 RepID=UPI002B1F85FA|nr:DUF4276 family protein [Crocosphaera sp. XPORK-15E]MEA5534862.1 DUF4276 family protein [Crocosphaera sp. XPORK-15E]